MKSLYTIIEVAEELNISIHEVYELIKNKELKGIKLGTIKILKRELLNYIDKNKLK